MMENIVMPVDKEIALGVCSKKKIPMYVMLLANGHGKIQPMDKKETWLMNKGNGWKWTSKCPAWLRKRYMKTMEKE